MPFDPAKDIPDLSGKVIFVTGGTAGIGKATLLALAVHNPAHIYFTGRNANSGSAIVVEAKKLAPNCEVTFIPCDLSATRQEIRRSLAENFTSSRLDILIANAGIMAVPPGLTAEGFEVQFGTNYFGHAVLLHLLRPVMLRTAELEGSDVRIVMLSSFGHNHHSPAGIDFDNLKDASAMSTLNRYGRSKLADILLAKAMAKRYPQITSLSIHPGTVKTELARSIDGLFMKTVIMIMSCLPILKSAEEGSWNSLWAATVAREKVVNGGYYEPVGKVPGKTNSILASGMAEICKDEGLADRLWEWTEQELKDLEAL